MSDSQRSEHGADRIIVIESLGPDDGMRTGTMLVEDFFPQLAKQGASVAIETSILKPQSKQELFAMLSAIALEVQANGAYPILHFEIHGSNDATGVAMANGEEATWKDLGPMFEAVNYATRNNTVVVLATCNGDGLQTIMSRRRAPFWGLVAPTGIIHTGPLYAGMKAFYTELLTSQNGDEAVRELNRKGAEADATVTYVWRSAEGVFRDACRLQLENWNTLGKRQAFTETKLSEVMTTNLGRQAGLRKSRMAIKGALKTQRETAFTRAFAKVHDYYLMLDEFPEQRSRFSLSYEDCLPKAKE